MRFYVRESYFSVVLSWILRYRLAASHANIYMYHTLLCFQCGCSFFIISEDLDIHCSPLMVCCSSPDLKLQTRRFACEHVWWLFYVFVLIFQHSIGARRIFKYPFTIWNRSLHMMKIQTPPFEHRYLHVSV